MGYKIRELREEKRMTQEELAEKSNVSRMTITAIETNKATDVKISTLLKLATALDTTVQDLFF